MSSSKQSHTSSPLHEKGFVATRWSVVLQAGRESSPQAGAALETLCRTYWYPLYAFVRRQGYQPHDAQDLTQSFFARLLEKRSFGLADPRRGRFRSFLLKSLKNFLINEHQKLKVQKRGGQLHFVSLDQETAETRYQFEPSHELTPEKLFERRWALTLVEGVLLKLRKEYASSGRKDLFDQLKPALLGDVRSIGYKALAGELKMSEGSIKVAVHRLRQRYRALFRSEVADTVADAREVDEELRHIVTALKG